MRKTTIWPPIGILLIVVFNAAVFAALERQRRTAVAAIEIEAASTATLIEASVSEFIESSQRTLTGLAQLVSVTGAMVAPPRPEVVAALTERRRASPALTAFLAFDAHGNLRLNSQGADFRGGNVADRPYFIHHRDTPGFQPLLGPPLRNRTNGAWIIPLTQRLETPDGRFAGVMLSGISPLHFVDMFDTLANEESTTIILRHVNGAVIASLPNLSTETEIPAPARNDQSIATRRHSSRHPVQVEVVINLETRLAPWRQERNAALVLALCGSVVIAAGAFGLRRQTLRRRQVLADLAETNARLEQRVQERTTQLQTTANRLQSFLSVAQDAVVVIDHQGLITEFNPAAQTLFGYEEDEVIRQSINMLMPPRYAATHDNYLAHARMQPARNVGRGREMVGLRKDCSEFPIELTVGTHRNGDTMIHVGVIRDITERKQAEARLTHLATVDGLTEMLNRTAFLEQGNRLLAESKGGPLAVLMVDADHFKHVNDTHGHAAGDQVLRHLATILRESARGADIAGRIGGEEFALILAQAPGNAAERVANQILNRVRATQVRLSDACILEFRVSIGIAIGTEADGLEHLLSRADHALYAAKNQGRDRAVLAATD